MVDSEQSVEVPKHRGPGEQKRWIVRREMVGAIMGFRIKADHEGRTS